MSAVTPEYAAHEMLGPFQSRYVDPESIPWQEGPSGMRMKELYRDNAAREALILIETPPGCVLAEHEHTGLELTYVIEGTLEDDEGACSAGQMVWRPPGSRHQARTPNGAKFMTLFRGGARTIETGRMFPNFDE